mgnify:FL=1
MIKKIIAAFAIIVMPGNNLSAQDPIFTFKDKQVKDFLVREQILAEETPVKKAKTSRCPYFAYELITNELLKPSDKYGIYRVGAFVSDTPQFLMILNNKKKIFSEYTDLISMLEVAFELFEDKNCPFTDAQKLEYVETIICLYETNEFLMPSD